MNDDIDLRFYKLCKLSGLEINVCYNPIWYFRVDNNN